METRLNTGSPPAIARAMLFVTACITLSMLSFALAPSLVMAVSAMTAVGLARGLVANPFSVRIAVSLSSLLLAPAPLFIRRANRLQPPEQERHGAVSESIV